MHSGDLFVQEDGAGGVDFRLQLGTTHTVTIRSNTRAQALLCPDEQGRETWAQMTSARMCVSLPTRRLMPATTLCQHAKRPTQGDRGLSR
jgi:hypothetical protein